MILNLEFLDIGESAFFLLRDILTQLRAGHCLLLPSGNQEILRLHGNDGIHLCTRSNHLTHTVHFTDHVIPDGPFMNRSGIVGNSSCCHVRHQLLINEFIQRKTIAGLVVVLVSLNVGYHATIHFQLHIPHILLRFLSFVFVLEIQSGNIPFRNHVCSQAICQKSNDGSRNHIGAEQTFETHPRRHHGNNLRVLRQFGGKENHRNEDKQRTEQIREIRDEVHVIIKDDCLYRSLVIDELVHILIDIEHHCNTDDQGYGKEVGSQELENDIPVYATHPLVHPKSLEQYGQFPFTGSKLFLYPIGSLHHLTVW